MIVLNSSSARRRAVVAMIAVASLTAACGSSSREDEPASVQQRRGEMDKQATPSTPRRAPSQEAAEATGEVPQQILALFQDDLARRALVKPETITVVSATEQQWSDGSMGCPKPGEMYPQMIVPGYRAVLQAAGEKYAYHSDRSGKFVVCANGLALPPAKQQLKSPASE
jgi:hypothetical protein